MSQIQPAPDSAPATGVPTAPFIPDIGKLGDMLKSVQWQTVLPQIARAYAQYHWLISLSGYKIPAEAHAALIKIAKGEQITPEEIENLKALGESEQRKIGDPVLTKNLARIAYHLHVNEGMSTRDIAAQFTKDGNPCVHTTVVRYIKDVEDEIRHDKIRLATIILKTVGLASAWIVSVIAFKLWVPWP